jgi:hypothetical protein
MGEVMKDRKPSRKITQKKSVKAKNIAKAATKASATVVKACGPPPKTVPVMIRTKFYGNSTETQQIVSIPLVEDDMIRLDLTIDLRKSEFIEIRPLRRAFNDTDGMISDAQSLANR